MKLTYTVEIDDDAIGTPFIENDRVVYSVSRMSCDFDSRLLPEHGMKIVGGIKVKDGKKFITVEKP